MSGSGTYSNVFPCPAPTLADILATAESLRRIKPPPRGYVVSPDVAEALKDDAPPSGIRLRLDASGVRIRVSEYLPPGTCVEDALADITPKPEGR